MLSESTVAILDMIADTFAILSFAGISIFIILYSTFYYWRKRKAGKAIMYVSVAYVLVTIVSSLSIIFGDSFELRPVLRVPVWAFGVGAVGYLLYALLYNWRDRHPIEVLPKTSGDKKERI